MGASQMLVPSRRNNRATWVRLRLFRCTDNQVNTCRGSGKMIGDERVRDIEGERY